MPRAAADPAPRNGRRNGAAEGALPLGYFDATRTRSAGFIAALPLLFIYELGILGFAQDINAAAFLVKLPISWLRSHPAQVFGADPILILNALLIIGAVIAAVRLSRRGALHAGTFGGMLIESGAYALLLGPLTAFAMTGRLAWAGFRPNLSNFHLKVVASCGAGLYEELFFRAILLGAMYYLAREAAGLRPAAGGALSLAVSGAIFSAAHFLSPGETVGLGPFIFRLLAGILLGVIFLVRGFGIAAWTHALYDVYLLCFVLP